MPAFHIPGIYDILQDMIAAGENISGEVDFISVSDIYLNWKHVPDPHLDIFYSAKNICKEYNPC